MKILYANPVFLDYRLSLYKELNRLSGGQFHAIFSKERYRILNRLDLFDRIKSEMKENAHPLTTDYLFDTNSMSFHMKDIEKGRHIPFTFGLIRTIRKIKPDILITEGFFQWTPLVILYSLLFRKPVYIGYERTPHTERNTGKLKTLHRKFTDKFVKGYLVNGSETKKYLQSIGIDENKIHIGGMSADSEGLKKGISSITTQQVDTFRREYTSSGLIYLFVGRVSELKGITYLLKSWKKHIERNPKDKLIIVGGGIQLNNYINEYVDTPSIIFTGPQSYNEIYKYYAIADVFILPTLIDNWSLVIPEAMACGKPVATSIYNGCHPELVRTDVNGIVFDPLDDDSLCGALEYFHHVDLAAFGKASVEIEKEFSTEKCAERIYNAISQNYEN